MPTIEHQLADAQDQYDAYLALTRLAVASDGPTSPLDASVNHDFPEFFAPALAPLGISFYQASSTTP